METSNSLNLLYHAYIHTHIYMVSPVAQLVKNRFAKTGDTRDTSSIPRSGRFLGGRNGNPFQYSCLENPMDRRTWWATVPGVTKSRTWLSDWAGAHRDTHRHTQTHTDPHTYMGVWWSVTIGAEKSNFLTPKTERQTFHSLYQQRLYQYLHYQRRKLEFWMGK